tara:strand:+ start:1102 stop:1725 length:624 start_codon:yes stop_codon:yes gene_type:complete
MGLTDTEQELMLKQLKEAEGERDKYKARSERRGERIKYLEQLKFQGEEFGGQMITEYQERIQTLEAEATEQADFLNETVTHTQEVEKELVGLKKRYKLTIDYHNKKDIGRDTQLSGLLESNLKLEQKVQTLEAELKEALEYMSTWHSKSLADTQKLARATDALRVAKEWSAFLTDINDDDQNSKDVLGCVDSALSDITEGQDDAITC